ncbi:MAG: hypothetical protein WKG01_19800 [Kofleriaceae bacterium]
MRTALVLSFLAATSCASESMLANPSGGTQTDPVPAPPDSGPYRLTNTVDFTVEAVVPAQVELVIETLREFSTNPAHALITIADRAGVPAVGILYNVIPGVIKDRIEGWINGEIEKVKINGKPITEYAGDLVTYAEIALTQFAVESQLTVTDASASHRLTALDLSPTGFTDLRIPITGLAGDVLTQAPAVVVGEGGALAFGEQHFGLNYGEYAWQGLEAISTQLFGGGIRTTFGKAIKCPTLASTVADKCFLNVCVGHETELRQICEGGLDAIVNFAHDRMAAMRLEALQLASGTGRLVDDDGDGYGDQITDGTWDAKLNIGLGLRHAPATFVGER